MVLKEVVGLHGGWLIFLIVLFTILSIASIIWLVLYVETSQRKNWKVLTFIVIITAIILAFELEFVLLQNNIIL